VIRRVVSLSGPRAAAVLDEVFVRRWGSRSWGQCSAQGGWVNRASAAGLVEIYPVKKLYSEVAGGSDRGTSQAGVVSWIWKLLWEPNDAAAGLGHASVDKVFKVGQRNHDFVEYNSSVVGSESDLNGPGSIHRRAGVLRLGREQVYQMTSFSRNYHTNVSVSWRAARWREWSCPSAIGLGTTATFTTDLWCFTTSDVAVSLLRVNEEVVKVEVVLIVGRVVSSRESDFSRLERCVHWGFVWQDQSFHVEHGVIGTRHDRNSWNVVEESRRELSTKRHRSSVVHRDEGSESTVS